MKKMILYLAIISSFLYANRAHTLLKENKCMSCHNVMGIKSAPSFSMILKMNSGWFGISKSSIRDGIKNGSQGKYPMFSDVKMPAYKNLSKQDLNTLVNWIVSQGSRGMHNCMKYKQHKLRMMRNMH